MLAALLVLVFSVGAAFAGDPTGSDTGTGADIVEETELEDAEGTTLETILNEVGHMKVAINFVWTLLAGALVLFMQAGFAMVETGFTRAKNAAHVTMTNFVIFSIGLVGFWAVGFPLMFGGLGGVTALGGTSPLADGLYSLAEGWGIFGTKGWFLSGGSYDVGVFALFFFQMVFMDTAATIPTGAMAERWKFSAFVVYGLFISMLLYPLYGNWIWGGGWLSQIGSTMGFGHGAVDFAGSGVVHAVGGLAGLAGAAVLGPRIGKFKDGKPVGIPGHNLPIAFLGTFILLLGWVGFNAGSTLAGTDLRISVILVNTMIAGAFGSLVAMFRVWRKFGKPDPSMTANGMLAGLVAITAPCAFVPAWAAAIIGAVAGWLVVTSVLFIERRMKIDDPVGAVSVHGACGIWGVLSLGIFADGVYGDGWNGIEGGVTGILYGDGGQLLAQVVSVGALLLFVLPLAWIFFRVQHSVMGIRSKASDEVVGLDMSEMGALAYPDFAHAGEEAMNGAAKTVGSPTESVVVKTDYMP